MVRGSFVRFFPAVNGGAFSSHLRNQTGDGEGAPLGVCLNSGMVNVNGEYESPADVSARTGVHAEEFHPFTGG
jgi:hypothetical protein